jgi:hypothetical protein
VKQPPRGGVLGWVLAAAIIALVVIGWSSRAWLGAFVSAAAHMVFATQTA